MGKVSPADTRHRRLRCPAFTEATMIGNVDLGSVGVRSARDSEAVTGMDVVVLDGGKITRLSAFVDNPDE
jgi:hypothetical protein